MSKKKRRSLSNYNPEWSDGQGGASGVNTQGDVLIWWHRPGGPNGHFGEVAREQTFADYCQNGAPVPGVPQAVVDVLNLGLG